METRQILQLVLALIVVTIVGLGSFIAWSATRSAETVVVKEVIKDEGAEEIKNPWEFKGDTAIKLVKTRRVEIPTELPEPDEEGEDDKKKDRDEGEDVETEKVAVGELLEREEFVRKILRFDEDYKKLGWRVTWWGETEYGEWFYLVRYAFKDAHITVGPAWLVDLKEAKVVPKNILARAVMDPTEVVGESEYYNRHQQVVSALASHRFESGLTLGGALLMHFQNREESAEGDSILGWTIEHDRGDLFKAYFQWVEAGEPTYAEFEFDYKRKALKASNLQAADVMRIGEDFDKTERAEIMPEAFDPTKLPGSRWVKGPCKKMRKHPKCKSLASILKEREVVEALEWLLTAQSATPEKFKECKKERACKWGSKEKGEVEGVYTVSYIYSLDGEGEKRISWDVAVEGKNEGEIDPSDRLSTAAWLAVHPRSE